jgi:hypothetical protein
MPDIDKINNVAVADISKFESITFADGQKVNNQDVSLVTDAHVLLATETVPADSSAGVAAIDFTTQMSATYNVYEFHCTSLHPASDNVSFGFQVNASNDTGGDFDVFKMNSALFESYHKEDGSDSDVDYSSGNTVDHDDGILAVVPLLGGLQNDADSSASGIFTFWSPYLKRMGAGHGGDGSSYSAWYGFQKHFHGRFNFHNGSGNYTTESVSSGSVGTYNTDFSWRDIPEIRFRMSTGNIDAGEIKMYGLALA